MAQSHHEFVVQLNEYITHTVNARLGEKKCVNRSTGLLPSAQVSRCTVQYIYCMLFFLTRTVSHYYISNDSISCNLLHFLIS